MIGGVNYERIGDEGLLVSFGERRENPSWIACDTVVLCAGQLPLRPLPQGAQVAQLLHLQFGTAQVAVEALQPLGRGGQIRAFSGSQAGVELTTVITYRPFQFSRLGLGGSRSLLGIDSRLPLLLQATEFVSKARRQLVALVLLFSIQLLAQMLPFGQQCLTLAA